MVRKRPRIEPTDDWQELLPLFWWPEQVEYERMRQPVLFGSPVAERAEETGVSERTLQRRIERFEREGMEGLFGAEAAKRRRLPPNIRRLVVVLKAEYPPFKLNEIANVVRACFGRKPDVRSVKRVLDEEALPLKLERNYPRYHEMDPGEGRAAVVELRVDGWSVKAIAGCHRRLPRRPPLDRLPDPRALHGGRSGRSRGQASRKARRREKGDPRGHRGGQEARAEPADRRVPGARRPQAEGLQAEPHHLRQDPRPGQGALRLRQAKERQRVEESHAVRLQPAS